MMRSLRRTHLLAHSVQYRVLLTRYNFPQQLIRRHFTDEDDPGETIIQSESLSWAETRDPSFRDKYNPSNIGGEKAGHGIAFEKGHVKSFNRDAAHKGASVGARLVPNNPKIPGSPDIEIFNKNTNEVTQSIQCKNMKTASRASKSFKDSKKDYIGKGQTLLTNKETAAKGVGTDRITYRHQSGKSNQSNSTSKSGSTKGKSSNQSGASKLSSSKVGGSNQTGSKSSSSSKGSSKSSSGSGKGSSKSSSGGGKGSSKSSSGSGKSSLGSSSGKGRR